VIRDLVIPRPGDASQHREDKREADLRPDNHHNSEIRAPSGTHKKGFSLVTGEFLSLVLVTNCTVQHLFYAVPFYASTRCDEDDLKICIYGVLYSDFFAYFSAFTRH